SVTPRRRCSGELTKNRPPNDQYAWPPRFAAFSCSTSATFFPALVSSWAATSPARPAPTTIASASIRPACLHRRSGERQTLECAGAAPLIQVGEVRHRSGRVPDVEPGLGRRLLPLVVVVAGSAVRRSQHPYRVGQQVDPRLFGRLRDLD